MYFKILNDEMKHHGMQYQEGLNVDIKHFIPISYCGGGLFFSDEKNILEFCDYGNKIAVVEIPEGEQVVQVDTKYKAHSIILKDIRPLWTTETFRFLLDNGVDIHVWDDCALRFAAARGYLEIVKYLIERGADIHAGNDCTLCRAAGNGHLKIVKYLMEQGADIHAINDYALRVAAERGYLEIVKYLIEHGADIHAENDDAYYFAAQNHHKDVVEYLENSVRRYNPRQIQS